jgi:hypothetical protein
VNAAHERWVAVRQKWSHKELPANLRRYLARQLLTILAEEKDTEGLLALAKDAEFLRFQEQTFPDVPRAGTETMRLAPNTALAGKNFPVAAEMAFMHSARIEQLSQTNLLQLVQSGQHSRAVALAELAENWDTRLLARLAVAAALMANGSPRRAASLLDDLASGIRLRPAFGAVQSWGPRASAEQSGAWLLAIGTLPSLPGCSRIASEGWRIRR